MHNFLHFKINYSLRFFTFNGMCFCIQSFKSTPFENVKRLQEESK